MAGFFCSLNIASVYLYICQNAVKDNIGTCEKQHRCHFSKMRPGIQVNISPQYHETGCVAHDREPAASLEVYTKVSMSSTNSREGPRSRLVIHLTLLSWLISSFMQIMQLKIKLSLWFVFSCTLNQISAHVRRMYKILISCSMWAYLRFFMGVNHKYVLPLMVLFCHCSYEDKQHNVRVYLFSCTLYM